MATDYYQVLSISADASAEQIRKRFRQLVKERHPDLFRGAARQRAEAEFQDITAAFNVLRDPERRRSYDLERKAPAPTERQDNTAQLVKVYLNRGIRAFKGGNFREAAENFDQATKANPQEAQAWHHLALACLREKRWLGQARRAIDKALEIKPEEISYLKLAGKVYAKTGMTTRAKEYYNQALRLGGEDPAIREALAAIDGKKSGRFGKLW